MFGLNDKKEQGSFCYPGASLAILPQNVNTECQTKTDPCQSCDAPGKKQDHCKQPCQNPDNHKMLYGHRHDLALLRMAPSWPVLPLALGLTFPGHLVIDSLLLPKASNSVRLNSLNPSWRQLTLPQNLSQDLSGIM